MFSYMYSNNCQRDNIGSKNTNPIQRFRLEAHLYLADIHRSSTDQCCL